MAKTNDSNNNEITNNQRSDSSFTAAVERRAQEIADRMMQERAESLRRVSTGRVFSRFDVVNDIIENQKQIVTAGVWTNNVGTLTRMFTSSAATAQQKRYYYEIFQSASVEDNSEAQFSVAYGHRLGSGSTTSGDVNDSPTRAIYSQYRLLVLEPDDNIFTFGDDTNSDSIYAINLNRARFKEKLDPGNWQLHLAKLSGSFYPNRFHTGSNVKVARNLDVIKLIDDSSDSNQSLSTIGQAGRIYNIVSGTIDDGSYLDANGDLRYYGLAYPDLGILILNATMLNASASFNTVTGSNISGDNAFKLFKSISGSAEKSSTFGFTARNAETITSTHYFVRVKNAEYNFSNNPTFTTGSLGEFRQPTFIGDPKVYVTTVGLYNDRQECLAVAKLSQPILKSFSNEILCRVKLDW